MKEISKEVIHTAAKRIEHLLAVLSDLCIAEDVYYSMTALECLEKIMKMRINLEADITGKTAAILQNQEASECLYE